MISLARRAPRAAMSRFMSTVRAFRVCIAVLDNRNSTM
jgi:hypothetical protein